MFSFRTNRLCVRRIVFWHAACSMIQACRRFVRHPSVRIARFPDSGTPPSFPAGDHADHRTYAADSPESGACRLDGSALFRVLGGTVFFNFISNVTTSDYVGIRRIFADKRLIFPCRMVGYPKKTESSSETNSTPTPGRSFPT